ncbi:MAG: hypothetical protein Q8K32_07160 [Archangium sp.]|nr:hypothetical protein [Archangium sp.]
MSESTPLPYAKRRKGLTYVTAGNDFLLRIVDLVGSGISIGELRNFFVKENPDYAEATHRVQESVLKNDFRVLEVKGDRVSLTDRGATLRLERDLSMFAPLLVPTFVALDHALVALKGGAQLTRKELCLRMRAAHPGWKTSFAPSAQLSWLVQLGAVEPAGGLFRLTQAGQEKWLPIIDWPLEYPQAAAPVPEPEEEPDDETDRPLEEFAVPSLSQVWTRLQRHPKLKFSQDRVAAVHAGLWANTHRHFAVFAGLSGSGKTALANAYGRALVDGDGGPQADRVRVIPVSPGWIDATPLLGYAVPLSEEEDYEVPAFLQLLLEAAENPEHIYVVILDEMNLSHPEQYLAPVLSAMELTDQPLVIHNKGPIYAGVPDHLKRYPPNLVLIGTVNMDETTHGLSDKVLDRATTLEFWELDFDFEPVGVSLKHWQATREVLERLYKILEPHRLHFGRRVVDDVLAFLSRAEADGVLGASALDWALYGKVLPKFRGHDTPPLRLAFEQAQTLFEERGLKMCAQKVAELLADLRETGSARFWR